MRKQKNIKSSRNAFSNPFCQSACIGTPNFIDQNRNSQKASDLLRFVSKKSQLNQNILVKAYNHVNNSQNNPLITDPDIINLMLQAIPHCQQPQTMRNIYRKNRFGKSSINLHSSHRTSRESSRNNKQIFHYKINEQRKQIIDIQKWLSKKLQECNIATKNGQCLITQRMHALNMAHNQICIISGHYSNQMKNLFLIIQQNYHEVYEYIFQCLVKQNKKIKLQIDIIQTKNNNTIAEYQSKLLNLRVQQQKKSAKIIQNFERCINLKKQADIQLKYFKSAYQNQKQKVQFMEKGLRNALNLLVKIGSDQFVDKTEKYENQLNQLLSKKEKHNNSLQVYHKWCGVVLQSIIKINDNRKQKLQTIFKNSQLQKQQKYSKFKKNVSSTISQFMVNYDDTLSLNQAQNVLSQYMPAALKKQQQNLNQFNQQFGISCQQRQKDNNTNKIKQQQYDRQYKKFQIPSFEAVFNQLNGQEKQIQTQIYKQNVVHVSTSTQMSIRSYGFTCKPVYLHKQTSVKDMYQKNLKVQRTVYEGYKPKKKVQIKQEQKKVTLNFHLPQSKPLKSQMSNIIQVDRINRKRLTQSLKKRDISSIQSFKNFGNINQKNKAIEFKDAQSDLLIGEQNANNQILKKSQKQIFLKRSVTKIKKAKKTEIHLPKQQPQCYSDVQEQFDTKQVVSRTQKIKSSGYFKNTQNQFPKTNSLIQDIDAEQLVPKDISSIIQTLERTRSYHHIKRVQYQSKYHLQQMEQNWQQVLFSNLLKNKIFMNKIILSKHQFHIELLGKQQQKIRLISQSVLWNFRKISQLKKMKKSLLNNKQIVSHSSQYFQKSFISLQNMMIPIILQYYQLFSQYENQMKHKSYHSQINNTYYHRLVPIHYILFNILSPFYSKKSKEIKFCFKGIKSMKATNHKCELYDYLLEGGTVQFDILIKSLVYFNIPEEFQNNKLQIQMKKMEDLLPTILEGIMQQPQIQIIISNIKSISRVENIEIPPKISHNYRSNSLLSSKKQIQIKHLNVSNHLNKTVDFFNAMCKVYKAIKDKRIKLQHEYPIITEILSKNQQNTYYEDIYFLLQCLPLNSYHRCQILSEIQTYLVYWYDKEPMIPNDRLLFLILKNNVVPKQQLHKDIIIEYLSNKVEMKYKSSLNKTIRNVQWILDYSYKIFFKTPKVLYRMATQHKFSKNHRIALIVIVLFFHEMIESRQDKIYMPIIFNGLSAIII